MSEEFLQLLMETGDVLATRGRCLTWSSCNVLRGFLTRLRMGWLHRSVWVTPRDIRPDYDDLVRGAAVGRYAFLLEAETVLGQSSLEIVENAWDMDRLQQVQHWYHQVFAENLERLRTDDVPEEELVELARDEMSAYLSAMQEDPLLPRALCPPGYRGEAAYKLHKAFAREIARRL
ncbi:MAG: hypothetical protein JXB04_13065 [Kiritimatiellae bacterium]|nr:hypothetical protein [Kiritimatiellia bacterium]